MAFIGWAGCESGCLLLNYVIKVGLALSMVNYFIKVGLARSMVNYVIKVGLALSMENCHIKIGLALSTVDYVMVIGLALSTVDYVMVIGLALSHGDRADGKQPELLQRDRAGFDGGDLHHGRGQGQGLCGGQGHGQDHGSGGYPPYPGVEQSGQGSKLELPALPQEITPMDLGDWLTLIAPSMEDIANNASVWWESTLAAATTFYEEWRQSTPLQRVQLRPVLPAELKARSFERTEHRGVGLLLRALPTEMRSTIISNRDMSSTSILWRLLITYQPGGSGEKGQLLKVLTTSSTSSTASQLASHLRQWRRCFTRAREIGACVPDGTLMVYALESSATAMGKIDGQAAFRIASSRAQLGVDEKPEAETVLLYSQVLLAKRRR